MTALSTHTVYRGLLWSVGLLALTLVFGRVFCGWICPFGTLHHFFALALAEQAGARRHARRGQQDAHLPAREVLPALRVPRRRRRRERDRRPLRPDLHRGALDRPRGHPRRCSTCRTAALGAAQDVHSRAVQSAADHSAGLARADRLAEQAVLLPPDLVHRLPARRGPLREPLHPALLVPRALPARRVPRRLLALRALRDDEGPREVHRLQPVPRALPGRRLARRAASSGGRTSATCA